jgi:hypothetical protein
MPTKTIALPLNMSAPQNTPEMSSGDAGPGAKNVGPVGMFMLAAFLVLMVVICLSGLVILWPTPIPAGQSDEDVPSPITVLIWTFKIYDEVRLLLIVSLAGTLGTLVHGIRSLFWYIGNRALTRSWVAKYLMQPFAGTALAVVFYLVIRGGFFSPQAGFKETSPFGFAALAAIVGMFSEQAVLKLKEVAETVLAKPKPGEDSKPQDADA